MSWDVVEPEPLAWPERADYLAECPICGRMVAGDDSAEALEAWREHRDQVHHKPESQPVDLRGDGLINALSQPGSQAWTWAVGAVGEYFHTPAYTGRWFERFGRSEPDWSANSYTPTDLVAVSMLGVSIPAGAALELLNGERASRINRLLALIDDVPLNEVEFSVIGEGSPAEDLWRSLQGIEGLGWTKLSKLMARKRPALLPVYDERVAFRLELGKEFWHPMYDWITNADLVTSLRQLRGEVGGIEDITLLRLLDVAVWRYDVALRPQLSRL